MTNPIEDKWRDQAINEKVESLQKGNQTVSFTDEDLKRLKEDSESNKYNRRPSLETVKALLARLEAAQRVVEESKIAVRNLENSGIGNMCKERLEKFIKEFEQSCGKDGV